jgi:tetratricopeptide (TPR) repeat protein
MMQEGKMRTTILGLLLGLALFAPSVVHAASSICDPNADAISSALNLKDPLQAQSMVLQAQKLHPKDFHTAYALGLILLKPSKYNPGVAVGQSTLLKAAEKLTNPFVAACASTNGWYAIYNAIGMTYYNTNDLIHAESYFLQGEKYLPTLRSPDRISLLSNLGSVYAAENNLVKSQKYYEAAKAASADPATPVPVQAGIATKLDALRAIRATSNGPR